MMQELLVEYPGFYILSGCLSQDPLEQHFSAQRRRGGPTAHQFSYNELGLHTIKIEKCEKSSWKQSDP